MNAAAQLARRLGGDALVLGAGSVVTVVLAFVNVAVVTRQLAPAAFGELAVYYVFAALLTILYGLCSLQGTLTWVFGSSGEEEVDDEAQQRAPGQDKRRALTTGLTITVGIVVLGTAVVWLAAEPLAEVLLGATGDPQTLVLAAVSAAVGAVWRLVSNVQRFSGRSASFAALLNVRPVLVLVCTVVILADGGGVDDVIAATVLGTVLSIAVGLIATLPNYAPSLGRADIVPILTSGAVYTPLVVFVWIVQNADLYILSQFASNSEVGVYRLANRAASVVSYAVSALLIAWVPMSRTSLFDAARKERGTTGLGRLFLMYYVLTGAGLVLITSVGADVLASVAPASYSEAAKLIPTVAVGFFVYGLFVVIYRSASFPRRRRRYFSLSGLAAATLLTAGPFLAKQYGSQGIALAVILSFSIAAAGMLVLSERGPTPLDLEWWRLTGALLLAVACYGVDVGGRSLLGDGAILPAAAAGTAYAGLLVWLGLLPREHLRILLSVASSMFKRGPATKELAALRTPDRLALQPFFARPGPGERTDADFSEAVRILRTLADRPGNSADDAAIGRYLLSGEPSAELELRRQDLRRRGVDPLELHELEEVVVRLRRSSPRMSWEDPPT